MVVHIFLRNQFTKLHSALCGCVGVGADGIQETGPGEQRGREGGQCSSIISAPASENCLVCTCVCSFYLLVCLMAFQTP